MRARIAPKIKLQKHIADRLLLAVDLAGTFVFAVGGAMAGIRSHLDVFGVMVVSFASAAGGGIIRDLLIGAVPPASIRDRRYALAAFAGGAVVFFLHRYVGEIPYPMMIGFDAAGLALVAVSGAAKALDHKIDPFMSVLLGAISGSGGGTIRDVLLTHVPAILRVDVYAVAALAGAGVMVAGIQRGLPRNVMMGVGFAVCFLLRVVSVWRHWNLPTVSGP
ncbi:membrane protein [Capsulimonas corticalis]|uniref:Membrane protein n=1 Tax=Capsulimonas corticalis TaxID=2219043 RepID=A0A402CV34_9BACT|nr:trimeric intracellular cation channel family protein [Capsulimonas corticalis]BDI30306.1 membrane protein [Capsulimonas corticalis]